MAENLQNECLCHKFIVTHNYTEERYLYRLSNSHDFVYCEDNPMFVEIFVYMQFEL